MNRGRGARTVSDSRSPATFPLEAIAAAVPPGMAMPSAFAFSPDDKQLTYLLATGEPPVQRLYALDTATGDRVVLAAAPEESARGEALSHEEELRRQRARSLARGLAQYSRASHAARIVVPFQGDLYVQGGTPGPLRRVVDHEDGPPAMVPALSPDGERLAYVRDAEIYVVPAAGGTPRQITTGARGTGKTHGLAEYVAQEELDRPEGFWWSRDSRWIAFAEVDETIIPIYRIMHQGSDTLGASAQEEHHYPFAGGPNAVVSLGVVAAEGGIPMWMDLASDGESYLARAFWWPDGSPGAITLNREQTEVELLRFDRDTGRRTRILREACSKWVNLPRQPLEMLEDGSFIWISERSGFRHLYLCDRDGVLVRQLTSGRWVVDAIAGVDERRRQVYFTANRVHPTEAQLYAVSFGGAVRRITTEPGTHAVTLDHACRRFVDVHSALEKPPCATLRSLPDGAIERTLDVPADPRVSTFCLTPPEMVTLRNRAGTLLYGAVYRPPASYGSGPYPTIVQVYGGPHAQMVTNSWAVTAALQVQYLRAQGFLVFRLDNRGSARRGLAFESALRHHMGTVEVADQVDGVRWLIEQGLADPARVGITGWSYGGYMVLRCLAQAPDTFKVGVAGAPVTAWDGYDTAYTERYMGTPGTNAEGYAGSSVLGHVAGIAGKLLLVHGMLDENVHFRHTARLVGALAQARKPYDLLVFPDERHLFRHHTNRVYLNERVVGFFQRNL